MKFIITVGNDIVGWNGYEAEAVDMDTAVMESEALAELAGVDEGTMTIKIEATS